MDEFKLDLNNYPKHNCTITNYSGFIVLKCNKCNYEIQERYEFQKYIRIRIFNQNTYYDAYFVNDYIGLKNKLLTCEEMIIKNIIE